MTWRIHGLESDLGAHKVRWDALNAELFGANPYYDTRFIRPLLKHFGTGDERLCIHTTGADIDAMLIAWPSRFPLWSLFVPGQAQIAPILARDGALLQGLLRSAGPLVLGLECPCQDPLSSPLTNLSSTAPVVASNHARTISVALGSTFEAYWSARSRDLRKSVSRRMRRVNDAGFSTRLKHITDASEMQDAVRRFGVLESSGWKGRTGTAVHMDNAQGRFYTDVLSGFASTGCASVYELYFGADLAAMQLAIRSSSMLVLLKTSYDERHAALAPGRLLLHQLLEQEFARAEVRTVEFYTNAGDEQAAWATDERWIRHYLVLRNSLVHDLYRVRERLARRSRSNATLASAKGTNRADTVDA